MTLNELKTMLDRELGSSTQKRRQICYTPPKPVWNLESNEPIRRGSGGAPVAKPVWNLDARPKIEQNTIRTT